MANLGAHSFSSYVSDFTFVNPRMITLLNSFEIANFDILSGETIIVKKIALGLKKTLNRITAVDD